MSDLGRFDEPDQDEGWPQQFSYSVPIHLGHSDDGVLASMLGAAVDGWFAEAGRRGYRLVTGFVARVVDGDGIAPRVASVTGMVAPKDWHPGD